MIGNIQFGDIQYGSGHSSRGARTWIAFQRLEAPVAYIKFQVAPHFNSYFESTEHYQASATTDSGVTIVYSKQVGTFKKRTMKWDFLNNQEKADLENFILTVQGSKYTFTLYNIRDEVSEDTRILNPNAIRFFPIEFKVRGETEYGWRTTNIELRVES